MSYVSTSGVTNVGGMVRYIFYGNGTKAKQNIENNTPRPVATFSTIGIKKFVERANELQKRKLKIGAISIVQSFKNSKDKFDYKNPKDAKYVNRLGFALASKLYPHSEIMVVTHNDGKNHHLHNHVLILNHDYTTGKAIKENRQLYKMRKANDELMESLGLSVIANLPKRNRAISYRTKQNLKAHSEKWLRLHDFDTILQNRINTAKGFSPRSMSDFVSNLADQGIYITTTKHKANGKTKKITGIVYHMLDTTKPGKERWRRRKASRLGAAFTFKGLADFFDRMTKKHREKLKEQAKLKAEEEKRKAEEKIKHQKQIELDKQIQNHIIAQQILDEQRADEEAEIRKAESKFEEQQLTRQLSDYQEKLELQQAITKHEESLQMRDEQHANEEAEIHEAESRFEEQQLTRQLSDYQERLELQQAITKHEESLQVRDEQRADEEAEIHEAESKFEEQQLTRQLSDYQEKLDREEAKRQAEKEAQAKEKARLKAEEEKRKTEEVAKKRAEDAAKRQAEEPDLSWLYDSVPKPKHKPRETEPEKTEPKTQPTNPPQPKTAPVPTNLQTPTKPKKKLQPTKPKTKIELPTIANSPEYQAMMRNMQKNNEGGYSY